MKKVILLVFILLVLGAIGWIAFTWYRIQQQTLPEEALSLVPCDAVYFIATSDPLNSWNEIAHAAAWNHLQHNAYFAELTSSVNKLDSLIRDNEVLSDLVASRTVIVSAHMSSAKDYDFLFVVDLQDVSGIKFLYQYLTTMQFKNYSVRKERYGDDDIIIFHDAKDKSNLYISMPGSHLIASYTKTILTSALDTRKENTGIPPDKFTEPGASLQNGIAQLYLNYDRLPAFFNSYASGSNEYVNRFSKALYTTSLNLTQHDEMLLANGYTTVNDSVDSYLKTLVTSGKGPSEFLEVTPQRTAFFLALGFTRFSTFFKNFETNIHEDVAEYKTYRENLKQIENYLKISMQENIIDWIGDEVVLLELRSSGKGLNDETAVILKADNIEIAKTQLHHIQRQVKKRTPIKFKEIEYKGFTINYLGMKGFFNLLLGKFFARYDKPYYTIVNNFVIFSNHPQTLQSLIDDYLDKKTLSRSEEFRTFRKTFDDESSVFIYLNTPLLFSTMKKLGDASTQASMEKNKDYIVCFRHIGFQLNPEAGKFKTLFAEQFVAPDTFPQTIAPPKLQATTESSTEPDEVETEEIEKETDPMALADFYVTNLNAKSHIEYFPDSIPQVEVELKNGFKDGSYTEYYESGQVKMEGHFKRDKRDGVWKLYDEKGKLLLRRKYDNGVVEKERVKE